jgi:hypothetical protein
MHLARSQKARTRTEAPVAASRLPSFHYQTRTGTVIGRPYCGANSVSPVPARIALQGGETREHRCDLSPSRLSITRVGNVSLPLTRKELKGLRLPHFPQPPGISDRYCCRNPVTCLVLKHTERHVLAEPSKDNKKQGSGQFFFARGARNSWRRCNGYDQVATPQFLNCGSGAEIQRQLAFRTAFQGGGGDLQTSFSQADA